MATGFDLARLLRWPLLSRRARSGKTIQAMVRLYCAGNGHAPPPLCPECDALLAYTMRRLERCVFGDGKPKCADCTVHCYRADMRERIRAVMRWAGRRLILRHPVLTLLHMIDGLRQAPTLAPAAGRPAAQTSGGKVADDAVR